MRLWNDKRPPPAAVEAETRDTDRLASAIEVLHAKVDALDRKLERVWLQVEFLRTRASSYLGDEIALTWLVDETPIYINSNDFGSPMNFLEGGRYEEDNLAVLQSLLTDRTRFVDVGANLGFFTLQIAQRVRRHGHVHAFEPHPKVFGLLQRSVFLNGLREMVTAHNVGLSERDATVEMRHPKGHVGGGHITRGDEADYEVLQAQLRPFDQVVGPDYVCDLMKIDVEGHELGVLRGMQATIARSPSIAILLENLEQGHERELEALLATHGLSLYGVGAGARLTPLARGGLSDWRGYVLATRPETLQGQLERHRFRIHPAQLNLGRGARNDASGVVISGDDVLFHGPYWYLPKGTWRLAIAGKLEGAVRLDIAERFGAKVAELELDASNPSREFAIDHDLVKFECVARARAPGTTIALQHVELVRLG